MNNWLKYLVALAAVLIAGSAAYFSVTGLGVLFSGAAVAVMIMAGSLEFAKLVTATYLKQKWSEIKGVNKWYLTSAVVILMLITSAGIFGYLSNAFQQQNLKLDQVQREIDVWNNKITYTNQQIATLQNQEKDLSSTQNSLINKGNVNSRLLKSVDNRDKQSSNINKKINSLQDSIVAYNGHINDIKNNNISIEREVGGFRFVAEAFGVELKSVVKFFIILIVIVFDPLAVALVISFNQLVMVKKKEDEEEQPVIKASDLVGEIARVRLSDEDLKILEQHILKPQLPNENLKKAAEDYKEQVKQKPWSNLPDDTWERMQKIEAQREAIHGPILTEDEPTGGLANSGPRERGEYEDDYKVIQEIYKDPIGEMMFIEDETRMNIIGQNGNEGLHYDNELVNEEETIIEPTEEEEQQNFSTIEPNTENIDQDNEVFGILIEEEPILTFEEGQLPSDMLQILNDVETETFSEEPTSLIEEASESMVDKQEIPFELAVSPFIQPVVDEGNFEIEAEPIVEPEIQNESQEDDEKKNPF
jgi:hypothetical protein